jgi:hypothetical protein
MWVQRDAIASSVGVRDSGSSIHNVPGFRAAGEIAAGIWRGRELDRSIFLD